MPAAELEAILKHYFNNDNIANVGDATGLRGSSVAGSLYVSFHTSTPIAGDQTSNEADYTGYARVAVARTTGGWTVSSTNATNAAQITFGTCTAGSNTITHVGIGFAASGAGDLKFVCALATSKIISTTAISEPKIAAGELDVNLTNA